MNEDPARTTITRALIVVPLLALSIVLAACGGGITTGAAEPSPTSTIAPVTTAEPTTTTPALTDVVSQIIADCEYNGSSPCPTVSADNVQSALTTWICPNVQLTVNDANGDMTKARSAIQLLINSGEENLVVNGRLAETALDEHLCPGIGS